MQEGGASKKTSGAVKGVKKALTGGSDDEDDEEPQARQEGDAPPPDRGRVTAAAMTAAGDSDIKAEPEQTGYYVYGVVRAGAGRVPTDLVGVDQAPVRTVEHGAIAAVVAEIGIERPPGRRADLVAHSEVLDALAASGVVVPVQFGSVLADRESVVAELLEPDAGYFAALLDELSGRAQYNLRATYHEPVVLAEIVAANPDDRRSPGADA